MTDPPQTPDQPDRLPDWEAFYSNYRKPGYVPGYEITSKLGGGAFGLVFRARKESIGKDYAIKFLKVDDVEVRQAVYRELEQVQYFAQVDHPNLVQIEDRGEVDGIPYLLMQFAGGETLRDRVPVDGPPSPEQREELQQLFLQACRGVAALHERSLVHFDLKPANVFLKGTVARVGDYGLSKLVTHSRGSLTMGRGTPYYMAPEILQRRGDERSDIYSLGVMLYELLVGRVPFTGDSEWEVLRKHESDEPEWPDHLLPMERLALQRCLAKDPDQRFSSVGELIAALWSQPAALPAPILPAPNLPASTSSAAMVPPPLPSSCVPPPLPAAVLTPPPLPTRKKRRSLASILPTALVLLAVFFVFTSRTRDRSSQARNRVVTAQSRDRAPTVQRSGGVVARVDAFVKNAQNNMRVASQRQRSPRLHNLSFNRLNAPRDIAAYVHMVENLAEAPKFSMGHATKLGRYGRPVFLAAVAALQEYDYRDADDCRCAAHTTALLAHLTGLGGLELSDPGARPSRADTCKFMSNADAWRKLAEQFASTDKAYRALLHAKGRAPSRGD